MAMNQARRMLLGLTGAAGLALLTGWARAQKRPRVIRIVAKKFVFVPATLQLKRGETVTLHLTAPEVPMGFALPDFQLRADVVPGKTTVLELHADKTGSFTYLCDVFCGGGHEDMSGTLVIA